MGFGLRLWLLPEVVQNWLLLLLLLLLRLGIVLGLGRRFRVLLGLEGWLRGVIGELGREDRLVGLLQLDFPLLLVDHAGGGFWEEGHVSGLLLRRLLGGGGLVQLLGKERFVLLGGLGLGRLGLLVHGVEVDGLLEGVDLLHVELLGRLVLVLDASLVGTLAPVLAKDHERVAHRIEGVLHDQVFAVGRNALALVLFQEEHARDGVGVARVELNDLLVGDGGLVGLGALLVEDAQVVPNLAEVGLERGGLDYGVEGLGGLVEQEEQNRVGGPEDGVDGLLVLDLLEALVGLLVLLQHQVAAAPDVERVRVVLALALGLLDLVQRIQDLPLLEGAPRQVLIHPVVVLVVRPGHLIRVLRLCEVALQFVQNPDLQLGIHAPLHGKITRDYRVLEVADRLV